MGNAAGVEGQRAPTESAGELRGSSLSVNYLDDLAQKLQVSHSEVELLYERFLQFEPDSKGLVERKFFENPPYSTDPFSRQIWMRITGEEKNQQKFSFFNFAKTMVWWQKAPQNSKLEVLFSWMKESEEVSPPALAKILSYTETSYNEDELLAMAEQIIQLMIRHTGSAQQTTPTPYVSEEKFIRWCGQMPQQKLNNSLEFKILNFGC